MGNRVETQIVPPTLALGLAVVAYALCVTAPFTFDDQAIFLVKGLTRPLTWLTYQWNGRDPMWFHIVNLLLHLGAVWLCADTLRRVLPAEAARVATLLFAVHPMQSEPVNYVWARSGLLMTVFCLLTLRDWLSGRQWRAVLWFALALAAKEECAGFPVFLFALNLSLRRDRREWRPIAAMLAVAVGAVVYTVWAASAYSGSQAGTQSVYTPLEYLSSQGLVILRYLQLLVIPWGFTIEPNIPTGWWVAWIPVLLLAGLAARRFRDAAWGFWLLSGLLLLLPSSSFFPVNDLVAYRRMYLPMIAFAAAAALWIPPRVAIPVALVLTALTMHRTWTWSDNKRLWAEAVEHSPQKVRPRIQLAKALPPTEAIAALTEAKKIEQNNVTLAIELVMAHLAADQPWEALNESARAVAIAPGDAQAINARGVSLAVLQQNDAARADFERALKIEPCLFSAHLNLKRLGVGSEIPPNCGFSAAEQAELK